MARMGILRRLTAIVAFTAAAAGVAVAAPTTTANAAAPRGTLLIVPGQSFGATPYTLMADALRRDGYRVRVLDLMGTQLVSDAHAIGRAVDAEKAARPSTPVSLVGHSVGEVAAAYVSGGLSLADAVAVGYHRSRLQATTAGTGRIQARPPRRSPSARQISKLRSGLLRV